MTAFSESPSAPDGYLGRILEDYVHPREVLADERLSVLESLRGPRELRGETPDAFVERLSLLILTRRLQ